MLSSPILATSDQMNWIYINRLKHWRDTHRDRKVNTNFKSSASDLLKIFNVVIEISLMIPHMIWVISYLPYLLTTVTYFHGLVFVFVKTVGDKYERDCYTHHDIFARQTPHLRNVANMYKSRRSHLESFRPIPVCPPCHSHCIHCIHLSAVFCIQLGCQAVPSLQVNSSSSCRTF